MSKVLFILPKRGLFSATICQQCGHVFRSTESDTSLVTVRSSVGELLFIDPTTQKTYPYPKQCPVCGHNILKSFFSGVEDLVEKLTLYLTPNVRPLFVMKKGLGIASKEPMLALYKPLRDELDVTTLIYDEFLDYSIYSKIVLVQTESTLSSIDYLAKETLLRSYTRLFFALSNTQELILDTNDLEHEVIKYTLELQEKGSIAFTTMYDKELASRDQFKLPPVYEVFLLTVQNTKKETAHKAIQSAYTRLLNLYPNLSVRGPYPAKMLKRKNMFAYHLLVQCKKNEPIFQKLRITLLELGKDLSLQIRLNPRHIF